MYANRAPSGDQVPQAVEPVFLLEVGELAGVMEGCARALRPGGLIAFSVEDTDGDGRTIKLDWSGYNEVAHGDIAVEHAGLLTIKCVTQGLR